MLTMEFGREDPRRSTVRTHGEWHLWLYMCSWRLESPGKIVIASEDRPENINQRLREIVWTEVSGVELSQPSLDLEISFQNRYKLKTFAVNSSDDREYDQWTLYMPGLICISAKGDSLIVEPSTRS